MAIFLFMDFMHDPVRGKVVAATPEEETRQQLVNWLLSEKGVPVHLMETECALSKIQPGVRGRVDVVVHGFRAGNGAKRPWLLAECKRPGESDWERLQVQVNRYIQVLCPEYLLLQIGDMRQIYQLELDAQRKVRATLCSDLPLFPKVTP